MTLVKVIKLLGAAKPLMIGIKKWLIADGSFNRSRALILLLFLWFIGLSIHFFGAADTEIAIELLEEVSDIIGVSD